MGKGGLIRVFVLCGIIVATGLILGMTTEVNAEGVSEATVFGLPLVGVGADVPVILAIGGIGVLCLGFGAGLVCIGFGGAGVLFATGQVAGGLITLAQGGVGITFFAGQAGTGLIGAGQGVLGIEVWSQDHPDGKPLVQELDRDLAETLSFR